MSEKIQPTAYPLRMPPALREMLEESARNTKRSLNAEITDRLEESFTSPHLKRMGLGELADFLIEMGQEKGLSVEVTFSQSEEGSDAPRSESMPMTTRVSKEKLLASSEQDRPATKKDLNEAVMDAMLTVMNALKDGSPSSTGPNAGPKPRKRSRKE